MYDFLRPHTNKDLQQFLGMVNFYQRFLPKIAQIHTLLTNLLKGKDLPKELPWERPHEAAFAAAKAALAAVVPLAHPQSDAALAFATDASDTHISGVLQQQVSSHWQPLGFFRAGCSRRRQTTPPSTRSCWRPTRPLNTFFPR
jgi:hypothetical protein